MSVVVPRLRIASVQLRPVLFSGDQEGSLGGPTLAIPRMGDRWAADIETTQLRFDEAGRDLVAALTQALSDDALIAINQPNRPAGLVLRDGVVNGNNVGGTALPVRNVSAGMVCPRGIYLSIVHGGRRYIHMTTAAAIATAGGVISLPIWPMLRFLTVDGAAVELVAPKIEGKLTGFNGAKWIRNRIDPLSMTIGERA